MLRLQTWEKCVKRKDPDEPHSHVYKSPDTFWGLYLINRCWCLMISSGSLLVFFNKRLFLLKWTWKNPEWTVTVFFCSWGPWTPRTSCSLHAIQHFFTFQSHCSTRLKNLEEDFELFWTWTGPNESAVIGNSSVWKRHNAIRCLWDAAFVWMSLFSNAFNKCSAVWRAQKPLFFWFSAIWIFPTIFTSIKRFKASAGIYMFWCCIEFKLISWSVQ